MIKRLLTFALIACLIGSSGCAGQPAGTLNSAAGPAAAAIPIATNPPALAPSPTFLPEPTQTPIPTRTKTPTLRPTETLTPSPTPTYGEAFGMDYAHPEKYLEPGKQTSLPDPGALDSFRKLTPGVPQLGAIFDWLREDFTNWRAGGSTIGAVTVEQLIEQRKLGGCHDYGLVFAAAARALGYPAVMVDAAGLEWAKNAANGKKGGYVGHVFVEIYFEGRWVLVDSTNGPFVWHGYDPANPVIPLNEGYYVMRKGVDTWGYGIHSNQELQKLMDQTASHLHSLETPLSIPTYDFNRLP